MRMLRWRWGEGVEIASNPTMETALPAPLPAAGVPGKVNDRDHFDPSWAQPKENSVGELLQQSSANVAVDQRKAVRVLNDCIQSLADDVEKRLPQPRRRVLVPTGGLVSLPLSLRSDPKRKGAHSFERILCWTSPQGEPASGSASSAAIRSSRRSRCQSGNDGWGAACSTRSQIASANSSCSSTGSRSTSRCRSDLVMPSV